MSLGTTNPYPWVPRPVCGPHRIEVREIPPRPPRDPGPDRPKERESITLNGRKADR